jgi:hypothetical protein
MEMTAGFDSFGAYTNQSGIGPGYFKPTQLREFP